MNVTFEFRVGVADPAGKPITMAVIYKDLEVKIVPRVGDTLQFPKVDGFLRPRVQAVKHVFNGVHEVEQIVVDCSHPVTMTASAQDRAKFDRAIENWRGAGFLVTYED